MCKMPAAGLLSKRLCKFKKIKVADDDSKSTDSSVSGGEFFKEINFKMMNSFYLYILFLGAKLYNDTLWFGHQICY